MNAAEVYRLLEAEPGPAMHAHRFKKRRGSRPGFQRQLADKEHTIWFQE